MPQYPYKNGSRCAEIRDKNDKWNKYWTINRSLYYEWIDFVFGDQWREDESKLFERYNKIPLMVNKLGVLWNHLMGDQIQNTPNLSILPDDDVPVETAQARAALIKSIMFNSDTARVFNTAFGQAVAAGFSAFKIGTKFVSDEGNDSFEQEIYIEEFTDPCRCYWDVSAKHPCKVDGMYAGYGTRVSRQWFKDKYGEEIERNIATSSLTEDSTVAFADDDSITILDHFQREGQRSTIYKLSDGSVIDDDEFKDLERQKIEGKRNKILFRNGQPVTVMDKRERVKYKIKHIQIAGDYILEESDFPSESLPIVFVDQKSYYTKQGQQITRSFFKDVKDAQKYLNYLATQSAYILKVSRWDQFIAPRKTIQAPDTMQIWRDPSVVRGALWYDEVPSGEKPQRIEPPVLSHSLTSEYERTLMDIQSGTGMYNAQLGEVGNEVSGTAIQRRTERGTKNTQLPRHSINTAIWTAGEIINEMIPFVYDTQRSLRLPMPNSESQLVEINRPADEYGLGYENDMTKGRYKIRIKPGPSYEGQKELALESMNMALSADRSGQVFPLIADLYVENLPVDNNLELRNRLRTLVPQEVIEAGKTGKPLPPKQPQQDPMVTIKMQEIQMKQQDAQMKFQLKMQELEHKRAELQRKALESHQDMTMQFAELEAKQQEAAAHLQEVEHRAQAEMARIAADLHVNHSKNVLGIVTHAEKLHHEKEMQEKEHRHQRLNKTPHETV